MERTLQRFMLLFMSLGLIIGSLSFNLSEASAHETSAGQLEDLRSLYEYRAENPDTQYEITDKKTTKKTIHSISQIKADSLLSGLNQKDLRDTHVTTQYMGKIHNQYDVHASAFEFTKDDEGWAVVVFYDVDREKLIDMARIDFSGDNAEITHLLTGNTVDLDESVNQNEINDDSVVIMWHPPGEQDLWNDPNCEWAAVVYCGILGFLVTPWGSVACGASWAALCH